MIDCALRSAALRVHFRSLPLGMLYTQKSAPG
jgi:hypothetical protein